MKTSEFGLAPSTLSTLVGQRDQIMRSVQRFGINKKEVQTSNHAKLEALLTWFREVTAAGVNIDGLPSMLTLQRREKAADVALWFSIHDF